MTITLLATVCFCLATISAVILGYRLGAEKWRHDAEAWRGTALSYRASFIVLQQAFDANDRPARREKRPSKRVTVTALPANELMAG